jgi:hypothetical protein
MYRVTRLLLPSRWLLAAGALQTETRWVQCILRSWEVAADLVDGQAVCQRAGWADLPKVKASKVTIQCAIAPVKGRYTSPIVVTTRVSQTKVSHRPYPAYPAPQSCLLYLSLIISLPKHTSHLSARTDDMYWLCLSMHTMSSLLALSAVLAQHIG